MDAFSGKREQWKEPPTRRVAVLDGQLGLDLGPNDR